MELSPHKIKDKLLKALDKDDNVLDMAAVVEVIALLEKISVSKDLLEETRLGKHINGLRKKTKDKALASRAKSLVRRWRDFILPEHTQNSMNGDKNVVKLRNNVNGNDRNLKAMTNINRASNSTALSFTSKPNSPLRFSEKCVSPCGISFSSASNSPSSLQQARSFSSGTTSPIVKSRPFEGIGKTDSASCVTFKPISPAMNVTNNSFIKQPLTSPAKSISHSSIDGRSRSPLVTNFDVKSPASRICSSISQTLHSTLDLDRTNAANKRLRKEKEFDCSGSEPKKFCNSVYSNSSASLVNGIGGNQQHSVKPMSPVTHDIVPSSNSSSVKRNRKKKSDDKPEPMESLKKKLAVAKTQKVKTTAQLIAGLQMNNSSLLKSSDVISDARITDYSSNSIDNKNSLKYSAFTNDSAEVKKSKSELLEKFLSSSPLHEIKNDGHIQFQKESPNTATPTPSLVQEEQLSADDPPIVPHMNSFSDKLNNVLSQLPPINPCEIQWDDDSDGFVPKTTTALNEETLNKLDREKWPEVNGNFSHENQWSYWYGTVVRKSNDDEPIVILPYVNID